MKDKHLPFFNNKSKQKFFPIKQNCKNAYFIFFKENKSQIEILFVSEFMKIFLLQIWIKFFPNVFLINLKPLKKVIR